MIPESTRALVKRVILGDPTPLDGVEAEIKARLPNEKIKIIFDVGANIGQSALAFSGKFPQASIFSFEPDPDTFQLLKSNVAGRNARLFNFALGSANAHVQFDNSGPSDTRRITSASSHAMPLVEVKTLESVFPSLGLDAIDLMKIDTEGHDLDVLKGSSALLKQSKIKLIDCECGINRDNIHHVPFHRIHSFLEDLDYRLFHIYEMAQEWPTRQPYLRRVNAIFISAEVIARNRWK